MSPYCTDKTISLTTKVPRKYKHYQSHVITNCLSSKRLIIKVRIVCHRPQSRICPREIFRSVLSFCERTQTNNFQTSPLWKPCSITGKIPGWATGWGGGGNRSTAVATKIITILTAHEKDCHNWAPAIRLRRRVELPYELFEWKGEKEYESCTDLRVPCCCPGHSRAVRAGRLAVPRKIMNELNSAVTCKYCLLLLILNYQLFLAAGSGSL